MLQKYIFLERGRVAEPFQERAVIKKAKLASLHQDRPLCLQPPKHAHRQKARWYSCHWSPVEGAEVQLSEDRSELAGDLLDAELLSQLALANAKPDARPIPLPGFSSWHRNWVHLACPPSFHCHRHESPGGSSASSDFRLLSALWMLLPR